MSKRVRVDKRDPEFDPPTVSVAALTEGICAFHLSCYVGSPYKDRGGLMLTGPPGVMKTTFLDVLDDNYHNALSISNAYMGTLKKLQASFYNGQVRSLCFPDLQSIYAGDPRTANRIEQMMMQLSGEATRTIGGDSDSRFAKFKGYCTIFAAMTDTFFTDHSEKWENAGFLRRFVWATYTFQDSDILMRAITEWKRADLGQIVYPKLPTSGFIPDSLNPTERKEIHNWLRHQPPPHEIQFQVLCKATAALRWHYKENGIKKDAMDTMREFSNLLGKDAALLVFPEQSYDKMHGKKLPSKGDRTAPRGLPKPNGSAPVSPTPPSDHGNQQNDSPKKSGFAERTPKMGNPELVPTKSDQGT